MGYAPRRHHRPAKAQCPEWSTTSGAVSHKIPQDTQTIQTVAKPIGYFAEIYNKTFLLR